MPSSLDAKKDRDIFLKILTMDEDGLWKRKTKPFSVKDVHIPKGIEKTQWNELNPEERFYLKGLDLESQGETRSGSYQELARGYGG